MSLLPRPAAVATGIFLTLLSPVFAQTKTPVSPPGKSLPPSPAPNLNQRNPMPSDLSRPVYISGRVVVEDGQPPADLVTIERVCAGSRVAVGRTDFKGHFSFQLNGNTTMMQDASESGMGVGPAMRGSSDPFATQAGQNRGGNSNSLAGCELVAVLAGYRSEPVDLTGRRSMDNPDIGTILLRRYAPQAAGNTVSATTLSAPKDARKAYERALEALQKGQNDVARKQLQKAVELHPTFAVALFHLAHLQMRASELDAAVASLRQAMAADTRFSPPVVELAYILTMQQKWTEVVETAQRGLKLDAYSFPQLFFYRGIAEFNLHQDEVAEKDLREAERLDAAHKYPRVQHLLGLLLEEKRDYKGAREHLEAFLNLDPNSRDANEVKQHVARLAELDAAPK